MISPPSAQPDDRIPEQDFQAAWARATQIPGWLKEGQARLLWEEAQRLGPRPTVLEIGSHQGRSTVLLGLALKPKGGHLIAVDPFVDGRLFGGVTTKDKFLSNVRAAGVDHVVELVEDYSTRARPAWSRPFDLLYIDGKHDYWTLSDDLLWHRHLPAGAAVVIHDCFSSIGVTLGILRHVLFSRTLQFERRSDSQALFRVGKPTLADRLRILGQLPWWVRNVMVKVLLRLRLRSTARWLFRHDSPYDPY